MTIGRLAIRRRRNRLGECAAIEDGASQELFNFPFQADLAPRMAVDSRIGWIALLVRPRCWSSLRDSSVQLDPVFPAIGIRRVFAAVGLQNSRPQISDFNFIPIRSVGAVYAAGSIVASI